jgi:hypothetical protein
MNLNEDLMNSQSKNFDENFKPHRVLAKTILYAETYLHVIFCSRGKCIEFAGTLPTESKI